MGKKTDIVDQLVGWGHAVVDAQDDLVTYSYLDFEKHGRIHNAQIFSAAEGRFEATLGQAGTRFIFYEFAHILSSRKTQSLMLFQPQGGHPCKLDLYGSANPWHTRAMTVGTRGLGMLWCAGVVLAVASLSFGLNGPGSIGLFAAAGMIWFSWKTLRSLRRMRDTYKTVLAEFPGAVEL